MIIKNSLGSFQKKLIFSSSTDSPKYLKNILKGMLLSVKLKHLILFFPKNRYYAPATVDTILHEGDKHDSCSHGDLSQVGEKDK